MSIGKDASWTNLHQVAREFVFKNAIFVPPEINGVPYAKRVQVVASGILAIEAHTAVALDAAIHLVVHKWAEILILKCAFFKMRAAVIMAGHHRHVLQVALAAFVAYWTIMGMVQHHSLNNAGAKSNRFGIENGDAVTRAWQASCRP